MHNMSLQLNYAYMFVLWARALALQINIFVILSYVHNQMSDLLKWFKQFGAEEYSAAAI